MSARTVATDTAPTVAAHAQAQARPCWLCSIARKGGTATADVRHTEHPLECDVSEDIRHLTFLWLDLDDPPSRSSGRALVEQTCIGLLSTPGTPAADPPGAGSLVHHAARESVRASGLRNVDYVGVPHDPAGGDVLEAAVAATRA